MEEFISEEQSKTISAGRDELKRKLTRLLASEFPPEQADLHATVLSEFWEIARTMACYIDTFSRQKTPKIPRNDAPDFLSETRADITHLREHIAQLEETLAALEKKLG